MDRPGRANEIEGWDAFVYVMRHRWWLLAVAVGLVAVGVGSMVADELHQPDCTFDGSSVHCEDHWTDWAGIVAAPLITVGILGAMWLFNIWLGLRIGAAPHMSCSDCGQNALPVHTGCRGWWLGFGAMDKQIIKARRAWARRSIHRMTFGILAVVLAAGVASMAYGATLERPGNVIYCDATGPELVCDEPPPDRGDQYGAAGMLLLFGGMGAALVIFLFRMVRPTFRPPDPGGPPGGW